MSQRASSASGSSTRNVAPPPGVAPHRARAVVRVGDRGDDRQAEPDAAARARARRVDAVEALEDPRASSSRRARARSSLTSARRGRSTRCRPTVHAAFRAACARARCAKQVVDHLAQPVAVAEHRRGLDVRRRSAARGRRPAPRRPPRTTSSPSSTGSCSSGRPSSSRASSSRSSTSTLIRSVSRVMPRHRAREVLGALGGAAAEQLGVRAHGGERRAQLVRRVGDEAPQLLLRGLARLERRLDLREHRVQREPEPADLGASLGALDAVREVAGGDRRRRALDRASGRRPSARPRARAAAIAAEHGDRHHELDQQQPVQRRVDVVRATCRRSARAVGARARRGADAVAPAAVRRRHREVDDVLGRRRLPASTTGRRSSPAASAATPPPTPNCRAWSVHAVPSCVRT